MVTHINGNIGSYKHEFNLQPILWKFSQAVTAFLQVEVFWFGLYTFLQLINELLETGRIKKTQINLICNIKSLCLLPLSFCLTGVWWLLSIKQSTSTSVSSLGKHVQFNK
jgi:hypothetical protein